MSSFLEKKLKITEREGFSFEKYQKYEEDVFKKSTSFAINVLYSRGIYLVGGKTQNNYSQDEITNYVELLTLNREFKQTISHSIQLFEQIKDKIIEISILGQQFTTTKVGKETIKLLPYIFFTNLYELNEEQIEKI